MIKSGSGVEDDDMGISIDGCNNIGLERNKIRTEFDNTVEVADIDNDAAFTFWFFISMVYDGGCCTQIELMGAGSLLKDQVT